MSHAETLRVFQRACIRAGIRLAFSQGFNPRPKISLPLPRPVGIESDDELIIINTEQCIIEDGEDFVDDYDGVSIYKKESYGFCSVVGKKLSAQLPQGCNLLSVEILDEKTPFIPYSAVYLLVIKPEYFKDEMKSTINGLLSSDEIIVRRQYGRGDSEYKTRQKRIKMVDVRSFLRSIDIEDDQDSPKIVINYEITPAGTIRVQEVLELLKLDMQMLAAPIKRTSVQWKGS